MMPYTTEKLALKDPFLDRRRKLLPCQKEMVVYWYKVQGASINSIAKMFRVNKRLIQFILFPERHKKNLSDRQDRGGSKIYYDREEHNQAMKDHRAYKHKVLKTDRDRRFKVRGKESIGMVLRKLREEKHGPRSGVKAVNIYPEFFHDPAHLTRIERGIFGMQVDKLCDYLKEYGADLYIVIKKK